MLFDRKTVLVVGSTPFAHEVRAAFAAEGAHVLDEAVYDRPQQQVDLDVLVDVGGEFAAKPLLKITDEDWRSGLDGNVVRIARYARSALPAMLLANRGVVVFLLSPRETEAPWERIHQEVTVHARQVLAQELRGLVSGSEVVVASVSSRTQEKAEKESWLSPGRGSRQIDAAEFVSFVARLIPSVQPYS